MKISPDIYEYMTNFADDKTILSMLSVNKRFSDDSFFQKILSRKYPYLLKFKEKNETYKNLYLRMIYAIGKLHEDYDIPYIPARDYDPYTYLKDDIPDEVYYDFPDVYYGAAQFAAEANLFDIVKHLIDKGANYQKILSFAAKSGNIDMVKYLFSVGAIDDEIISRSMYTAKNLEVFKYLNSKLKANPNYEQLLLYSAVFRAPCDIMEYIIEQGVSDEKIRDILSKTSNPETVKCLRNILNKKLNN